MLDSNFVPLIKTFEMALVAMSDASWGVRREGHSQGGYLLMLAPTHILHGEATSYTILDWRGFHSPRVCRSFLNAEFQACPVAIDSLEKTPTLIQGFLNAAYTVQFWVICQKKLVVDASTIQFVLEFHHDERIPSPRY